MALETMEIFKVKKLVWSNRDNPEGIVVRMEEMTPSICKTLVTCSYSNSRETGLTLYW